MEKEQEQNEELSGFRIKFGKAISRFTVRSLVAFILGVSTFLSILVFSLFSYNFSQTINRNIEKNIDDLVADGQGVFSRTIERFAIATEVVARDSVIQAFVDSPSPEADVVTPITRQKVLYSFDLALLLSESGELLYGDTQDDSILNNPELQQAIVRGRNLKAQQALIIQSSFYQKPVLLVLLPVAGLERNGSIIYGRVMNEEFLSTLFPTERRGVFIPTNEGKIGAANIFDIYIRKSIEGAIPDVLAQSDNAKGWSIKMIDADHFKGIIAITLLTQASFPVGEIGFFIDENELFAAEKKSILANVLVALGLGLMFLVALIFMTRFVVRPITQLAEGFSKVEKEDFSVRLLPFGLADLRGILEGFNKAMQQVSKRTSQLNEAASALGEKNSEARKNYSAMMNVLEDARTLENNLEKANFSIGKQKERAESILGFLRSIGDSVIATDMAGKIIFFNEAAEKITGVSAEHAMGLPSTEVVFVFSENDLSKRRFVIKETLDEKEEIHKKSERFVLRRKDASVLPISFSASFIYDNNKNKQGVILIIRDVSEERELEKTKDNFLSVAAHQLRTPLSGIRWNLEMLLEGDMGELPKEAKDVVKDIHENNLRLVSLVNDLLNVSRINQGKSMDSPKPLKVVESISLAIKNICGFAEKNQVKVVLDEKKNTDLKVLIIPRRFSESVENVISNAIKYSPIGGEVKISVSKKGDRVILAVTDSGIGIPKKDQERIFSKFFRASNAAIKDPEGSGLGLNVVKSFIEEAGGEVAFESAEGKGTTFFLTLPICK